MGMPATDAADVGRITVRAVVVVLSAAAAADQAWRDEYERIERTGARLVAVRTETIGKIDLPGGLAQEPWLTWSGTEAGQAELFAAVTADRDDLRAPS